MAPTKPKPVPRQQRIEVYTTTSTGHQVNSGVSKPVSWHTSRQAKINAQFKTHSSTKLEWEQNASISLENYLSSQSPAIPKEIGTLVDPMNSKTTPHRIADRPEKKIFANCSIYISGTTTPAITDHALKILLSAHGAHICTIIKRKTTTHVIVGSKGVVGSGAGGGIAAGKLQKELSKRKVTNIKYVDVKWALESVKVGRKLVESNFNAIELRSSSQRSIMGMLRREEPNS